MVLQSSLRNLLVNVRFWLTNNSRFAIIETYSNKTGATAMNTIQEINRAILAGSFTNDQLISIGDAIRFARAQLTKQKKRELSIGAKVKFTSNRNGVTYNGTVRKIAIKFVTVDTGQMLFKVPASMLEAV
jgi:hypothetical protein